jgi:hypothetical protein
MANHTEPVAPKPEPHEPFEDPIGILDPVHRDPVGPEDPVTIKPGIPFPSDPPPPKDAPPPPPGHAELAASRKQIPTFEDGTDSDMSRAQGIARSARDSFGDLWTLGTTASLRKAKQAAEQDPDKKDKFTAFRTDLEKCGLKDALDQWCTLRNSANPDFEKLAPLLATITDEVNQLNKAFDEHKDRDPQDPTKPAEKLEGDINVQMLVLAELAKGILMTIGSEADILLGGGRVPAAGHGEAICGRLDYGTADGILAADLQNEPSWTAVARRIESKLKSQVGSTGNLDNVSRKTALISLDKALTARDKPPAGSTPEQLGAAVLREYRAVSIAINNDIAQVHARLVQLAKPKPPKGWTKDQCETAVDLLVGSMRVVQDELGADALATDPDTAEDVRKLLVFCKTNVLPTRQESLAAEAQTDFGKFWRDGRNAELKALTKLASTDRELASQVNSLKNKFDKDFGPSLTAWSAALAKFPDHDRAKMHDLAVKIATTISAYRDAVKTTVGERAGAGLKAALDAIASGVIANIRSYQGRGGLFG